MVSYSNTEVLKLLIEKGADINALTYDKWTALHYAARYSDSVEVVKILIEKGANINALTIDK